MNELEVVKDRTLSLFEIEQSLAILMASREEVTDPDEIAEVDRALTEMVSKEMRKVDGIRAYYRHLDELRRDAETMAKTLAARQDRLKSAIMFAMQAGGVKRLDGCTGSLVLKGNGGVQPLRVQEDILPDEYRDVTVTMPLTDFLGLDLRTQAIAKTRSIEPANGRIRKALNEGGVPGAWLDERGQHVEVK